MKLDKKGLALFINLSIVLYLIGGLFVWLEFTSAFIACLMIFIFPGMAFDVFLFRKKRVLIENLFWWLVGSTIFLILGMILHVLINVSINNFSYSVYLFLFINLCFVIAVIKDNSRFLRIKIKYVGVLFCVGLLFAYLAVKIIPPLQDNTLTVQSTAYGIGRHLVPKTFTDRYISYEFAHPLLMHFYTASSLALSGKLEGLKYYYDYAEVAEALLNKKPHIGDEFLLSVHSFGDVKAKIIGIEGDTVILDNELPSIEPNQRRAPLGRCGFISENTIAEDYIRIPGAPLTSAIQYDILRKGEYWKAAREVYKKFYDNPRLLPSRLPNVFFTLAGCLAFYTLLFLITESRRLSLLGVFSLISIPELLIRALGDSYTSITLFCSIILIYYYLKNQSSMLFWVSLYSALSNHKLSVVVLAIVASDLIRGKPFNKHGSAWAAIFGFLTGEALFSAYGFSIHAPSFIQDHFRYHALNRILHIPDFGYADYPTILQLWSGFFARLNPIVLICLLASLFFSVKLFRKERELVLPLCVIVGAVVFSLVDWRSTKHLIVVLPAFIAIFFAVSSQMPHFKKIFVPVLLAGAILNAFILIYFAYAKDMLMISKHW